MTLAELIEHTRAHLLADNTPPYEWADTALTRWFNDAEDRFARETLCFIDADSPMTGITTEPGVGGYALDPRVFDVFSVQDAAGYALASRPFAHASRTPGKPRSFAVKPGPLPLQLHPVPDAVYQLDLVVSRAPLTTLQCPDDVPEIPRLYHLLLCDWVAYQALRTVDVDKGEAAMAEQFLGHWLNGLTEAKSAMFATQGHGLHVDLPRVI